MSSTTKIHEGKTFKYPQRFTYPNRKFVYFIFKFSKSFRHWYRHCILNNLLMFPCLFASYLTLFKLKSGL